jgi:hypothetical protein
MLLLMMFKQVMSHLSPPYARHSYRGGLNLGPLQKLLKCSTRKNCKESSWKCVDGKYNCAKCKKGFELKNGRCIRGGGETAITVDLPSVTAQVTLSGFTEATFDEAAQTAFKNAVRTAAAQAVGYSESFITVIIRRFGNTILSSGNRRRQLLDDPAGLDVVFSTTFEGALVANSFAELQALTAQSEQGAITFIATLVNNIATVFPVQTFGDAILVGDPVISSEVVEIEANFPVPAAPAPPTNVQNVGTDLIQWTGSWTAAAESRPLTYSTKCVNAGDPNGCFGTSRGVGQSQLTALTGQVLGLTPGTAYDCFAISVLVGDNLAKCSAPVRYTTLIVPVPMNLKVAPVEGEPLQRKLSWTVPSQGATGYTMTCTNVADAGDVRVTTPSPATATTVTVGSGADISTNAPLKPAAIYSCKVRAQVGDITGNESVATTTDTLECAAPTDTGFSVSKISGDPAADGWFKLGASNQLGLYAGGDSSAQFDVYMTSFRITQDIITASSATPTGFVGNTIASLDAGAFAVGDLVVGIGMKWTKDAIGSSNTWYNSLDQDGTGVLSGSFEGLKLTPATAVPCTTGVSCGITSGGATGTGGIRNANVFTQDVGKGFYMFRVVNAADGTSSTCASSPAANVNAGCPYGDFIKSPTEDVPLRGFGINSAPGGNKAISYQFIYNVDKLKNGELPFVDPSVQPPLKDFASSWLFKLANDPPQTEVTGIGQLACPAA